MLRFSIAFDIMPIMSPFDDHAPPLDMTWRFHIERLHAFLWNLYCKVFLYAYTHAHLEVLQRHPLRAGGLLLVVVLGNKGYTYIWIYLLKRTYDIQ